MIYLKLGGSLITDKTRPFTPRLETIHRIAGEIAEAWGKQDGFDLLIGHGSGSFGHSAAKEHRTLEGVRTAKDWRGFVEVWQAARSLNQIVMQVLKEHELPVMSFPPSSSVTCNAGEVASMAADPVIYCLRSGLIPVVYGDVAFDASRGGTIVSTERIFHFLAQHLPADRILLAGRIAGVLVRTEAGEQLLPNLTQEDLERIDFFRTEGADVTGGMKDKVQFALRIHKVLPGAEVRIFSAEEPGSILRALQGEELGTKII
jgi:isopentenyl phosphate kinase